MPSYRRLFRASVAIPRRRYRRIFKCFDRFSVSRDFKSFQYDEHALGARQPLGEYYHKCLLGQVEHDGVE